MSNLRHELRTPIHQILGYSELVAEEAAADGQAKYLADLARISAAARNLLALVDRITEGGSELGAAPDARPAEPATPPIARAGAPPEPPPGEGPRVLVVDDDEANRDLLAWCLRRTGYRVATAMDGPDALAKAGAEPYDLVLLDVTMPGMDGYEVCSRLRQQESTRRTPIIFVTAMNEVGDEERGLDLGAVDYIAKPFNMALLRARVRNHLDLKSYRDHLEEEVARRTRELLEATAARQKLESELAVARTLQRSMLPELRCALPGWEVSALLEPARAVGGDLLDYFPLEGGRLFFALGDVSDKGVPAALFMVRTLTLLRSLAPRCTSPGRLLATLNDALGQDNETCMFVTMALGIVHLESGRLLLASGGHDPPLLVPAHGQPRFLEPEGGPALGLLDGASFEDQESVMDPGDTLLLYTDGVTEAQDLESRMFGSERLQAAARPGAGLVEEVARRVAEFTGPAEPFDDLALLALGRVP